jgi:hypothetical protein
VTGDVCRSGLRVDTAARPSNTAAGRCRGHWRVHRSALHAFVLSANAVEGATISFTPTDLGGGEWQHDHAASPLFLASYRSGVTTPASVPELAPLLFGGALGAPARRVRRTRHYSE